MSGDLGSFKPVTLGLEARPWTRKSPYPVEFRFDMRTVPVDDRRTLIARREEVLNRFFLGVEKVVEGPHGVVFRIAGNRTVEVRR